MLPANSAELSIIHNHCAIELAIDNALYAMNVKMVFGNTPGLHHLRHRSHEPQVNEHWEGDPQRKPMLAQTPTANTSHPSIPMEITPLDVESPRMTTQSCQSRFFPAVLANHRSTPTTPAEETRYRKRLLDSGPVSRGLPSDWKGMMFTVLDSSADQSEDPIDVVLTSPNYQRQSPANSVLGDSVIDDGNRLSLTITPPSTPFSTPSLGSPTLTYSTRGTVKDASGTRRMMLKRKSSSFLRASASQPVNENVSGESHIK